MSDTRVSQHQIAALDTFTTAFLEAALFATTYCKDPDANEDIPLDSKYSARDLSQSAYDAMVADCQEFQQLAADLSEELGIEDDLEQAGHDFLLTREEHGSGFGDGDWDLAICDEDCIIVDWDSSVGAVLTALSDCFGNHEL